MGRQELAALLLRLERRVYPGVPSRGVCGPRIWLTWHRPKIGDDYLDITIVRAAPLTETELGQVLEALPSAYEPGNRESIEGGVRVTLRRKTICERCGRPLEDIAILYGEGKLCNSCAMVLKRARA